MMLNPEMLDSFKTYRKSFILSDLFAAFMVVVVALPLSIALGIQSGGTLQMGIVAAIIGGFCIAVFGGSRYSIGGPSASFVALCIGMIASPDIGFDGLLLAVLFAGILLIVASICKAGKLLELVPNTIIVGLTSGIGVILLFGQLKDFLGLTIPPMDTTDTLTQVSPFLAKAFDYMKSLGSFQFAPFCVGVCSLLVIFLVPRINKKIPSMIVAIVFSAIAVAILDAAFGIQVATVGSTYQDLSASFRFINFTAINPKIYLLIVPAFTFALIVALEGYTSATVGESLSGRAFHANQELFGHGIANIATGLCGGLPVVGALARTNVNITSGAKSTLSGILSSIMLLIVYLAFMPVMQYIPLAALAAVLVKVAINMSRFRLFAIMATFGKRDSAILISAFLLTILFGVLYGIVASAALAILLNVKNFGKRIRITELAFEQMKNYKDFNERFDLEDENQSVIQALHVTGSIFFANINMLLTTIRLASTTNDLMIVDLEEIESVDASSIAKLAKLARALSKNGKRLVLYNLNPSIQRRYILSFEQIIVSWK